MKTQDGFTLLELLVTVGIVGVLSAIALPQFAEYKIRAYNAVAVADLKNSANAQESAYIAEDGYIPCSAPLDCEGKLPAFQATRIGGVPALSILEHEVDEDGQSYTINSRHSRGDATFSYESVGGSYTQTGP